MLKRNKCWAGRPRGTCRNGYWLALAPQTNQSHCSCILHMSACPPLTWWIGRSPSHTDTRKDRWCFHFVRSVLFSQSWCINNGQESRLSYYLSSNQRKGLLSRKVWEDLGVLIFHCPLNYTTVFVGIVHKQAMPRLNATFMGIQMIKTNHNRR